MLLLSLIASIGHLFAISSRLAFYARAFQLNRMKINGRAIRQRKPFVASWNVTVLAAQGQESNFIEFNFENEFICGKFKRAVDTRISS